MRKQTRQAQTVALICVLIVCIFVLAIVAIRPPLHFEWVRGELNPSEHGVFFSPEIKTAPSGWVCFISGIEGVDWDSRVLVTAEVAQIPNVHRTVWPDSLTCDVVIRRSWLARKSLESHLER